MPWLKSGDNAATYPKVMQIAGFKGVDPVTIVNETFGWLTRCMLQSAGHTTDYRIDVGTAYMLGGPRTDELVALCKRAGLLSEVKAAGSKSFKLIADPEFMHMRLRAEIDAERQRQRDNANPALTVPVTLRDGDQCRYCGVQVAWRGKTNARTRTIDHREGLTVPATVDNLVVSCLRCNSARQLNPQWDDDHPLRSAPPKPQYGPWAADFLERNGYPGLQNVDLETKRPALAPGADTAPDGVRPATAAGDDTAPVLESHSTAHSLPRGIGTSQPGSGRDGTGVGLVGTGEGGSGPPGRRRGRRGGRAKPQPEGESQ